MKKLSAILLLVAGGSTAGCFSHYSDGPEFAPVTVPAGYGVVHVYRPKKATGAAQMIEVSQPGRLAVLPSGGFATFVVPVGRVELHSSINVWNTMIVTTIPGVAFSSQSASATLTKVPIDVADGKTYYVRTEFDGFKEAPSAVVVGTEEGESDIEDLHMAAGGRGRYPVLAFDAPTTP